jgi:hypothetical protein
LYVASGDVIKEANIDRYPEFVGVLDRHFEDLDARMAGFSSELDSEIRDRAYKLRSNLAFMSNRLRPGPAINGNNFEHFANMAKIGNRLHDFCLSIDGDQFSRIIQNVQAKIEQTLVQEQLTLSSMSLDDVCLLRFKVQDQLLAEVRKSDDTAIFTIADDMDQGFATRYFVVDRLLLRTDLR